METTVIIIIVAAVLVVAVSFSYRHFKKPKTELENAQDNLKNAEKMIKKQKETSDRLGQKLEIYKDGLIKKNDEMLKQLQRKHGD